MTQAERENRLDSEMTEEEPGFPYTMEEVLFAIAVRKMDAYHAALMTFLIRRVKRLEEALKGGGARDAIAGECICGAVPPVT